MIITRSQNSLYLDAGLDIAFGSDSNVKYIETSVDTYLYIFIYHPWLYNK